MATEDKQRILDWCSTDSDVRCVEEEGDPGAEFTLGLESGGAEVTATLPTGGDRLVLRSIVDLAQATHPAGSGDLAADLVQLEERRPGPVTASLDPAGEQVVISTWIVLDGLTKHSLLTAVSDLHRTWSVVLRLTGVTAEASATGVRATEVVGVAGAEAETPVPAVAGATADSVSLAAGISEDASPTTWSWSPAGASAAFAAVGGAGAPDDTAAPDDAAAAEEAAAPEDTAAPEDAAVPAYEAVPEYAPAPEADAAPVAETSPEEAPEAEGAGAEGYPEPGYAAGEGYPLGDAFATETVPEANATPEADAAPEAEAAEVEAAPEAEAAPAGEAAPDVEAAPAPSPWAWPAVGSTTEFATADASTEAPAAEQEELPVAEATATGAEEQVPATSPWGDPAETTFEPLASPYHPLDSPGQSYPESAAPIEFEATPGPLAQAASTPVGTSGEGYLTPFTPEAAAAPAPAPAPAQPAWTPGHKVPPQGMQAWAAPDPAGAVIATLGGHLPVQVTEVRGAWAHVLCSNGWTGWVDDRLLVVGA
jgi:hypothetical protein